MADTIHFNKFYVSKNKKYADGWERIFGKKSKKKAKTRRSKTWRTQKTSSS